MYSHVYPYRADDTTTFEGIILPEGSFSTPVSEFDFAVIDRTLVMTHYSGKIMPFYFRYAEDGTLTAGDIFVQGVGGNFGDVSPNVTEYNLANPMTPYVYQGIGILGAPMSDIGELQGEVTIGNPLGTFGTNRTLDITSTNADVAAVLQRSLEIYAEALGKNTFGGSFAQSIIVADTMFVVSNITNGVRVAVNYSYGGTPQDIFQFGAVTKTDRWAVSLWYAGNWPRTVTTYEGRLVFGGTPDKPLTLFGSKVNGYRQFNQIRMPFPGNSLLSIRPPSGPVEATDPYVFGISSKDDSRITFLQPAQALIVGTDRKEYAASGGDTILSALSVNVKPYTTNGSSAVSSVGTGSNVFFISNSGRQLFMFRYNSRNGTFVSSEVSLLFSDLIEGDLIKSLCWAAHRSTLFIVMQSKKIYGISVNSTEEEQQLAFFDPKISGDWISYAPVFSETNAQGFERKGDHCVIPQLLGPRRGFFIVSQEQAESGLSRSYVQEDQSVQNTHLYIDSVMCVQAGAPPVDPATDYSYFMNNKELLLAAGNIVPIHPMFSEFGRDAAYADELVYVIKITTSGTFQPHIVDSLTIAQLNALPTEIEAGPGLGTFRLYPDVSQVPGDLYLIGFAPPYAECATMPIEAGAQFGTAQMGIKNIDTLGIRFYKTYSYEISSDGSKWQEVRVADSVGLPVTGRKETKHSSSPDYDNVVYIRNTKPEPLTITGLNMRGLSNDG
jgi:hypothetical protein